MADLDELENLLRDLDGRQSVAPANVQSNQSNRKLNAKSTINMDELDDIMGALGEPSPASSKPSYASSAPVKSAPQPHRAQQQSTYQPTQQSLQPQRAQQQSTYQPQQHNPARNTLDNIDDLLAGLEAPSSRPKPQTASVYNSNNSGPVQQSTRLSMAAPNPTTSQPTSASKVFVMKPPSVRPVLGDDLNNLLDDLTKGAPVDSRGPAGRGACSACGRQILGEVISALGKNYHPEHFQCGNCKNPLGTSSFFEQDGVPHCERCYQELLCARCAHCDEPILDRCITALGRKWHQHHFICTQCLTPFAQGSFFERDSRPYCENCFKGAFAPRCAGCNQAINGECTNALGQTWHPEHFVCQYCQKAFTGSFYEYGGKPYCDVHYHQQTGSLCAGCSKAVTGRCIDALGKKWHPEHFVCAFCMNALTAGSYSENGGKAYCKDCHGKLFG